MFARNLRNSKYNVINFVDFQRQFIEIKYTYVCHNSPLDRLYQDNLLYNVDFFFFF